MASLCRRLALLHRLADAAALAGELEDLAVVRPSIQHGRRHAFALEDLAPLAERQVAGQQQAGSLVPVREDLEQQIPRRAAVIYSLAASCRLWGINPFAYRRDIPTPMNTHPAGRIEALPPRNWNPSGL